MDVLDQEDTQHKTLRMTVLATPDMANFSGHVHGGAILKLLDQVAYACASRYSNHYAVTVSVDQVFFREPVHVGELMTFISSINYTGHTSMEVGIRVIAENIIEKTERHVMTSYVTMVAVDDNGRPARVPNLKIRNEVEQRRHDAAALRRELRKEIERRSLKIRQNPGAGSSGGAPA